MDHHSLRSLFNQIIQTPEQQWWLCKFLSYDFDIEYKPGNLNGSADSLSCVNGATYSALFANLGPQPPCGKLFRKIIWLTQKQSSSRQLERNLDSIQIFSFRMAFSSQQKSTPLLLAEFHTTPTGIHRTLMGLAIVYYWPDLRRSVCDFVAKCRSRQTTKPFNRAPQGLLQPLPIPSKIWHSVSLDFITGMPPPNDKMTILVVVDRLTKHGHFSTMGTHFTPPQVTEILIRDVIKFHGILAQIVSDRDPIFMSEFWRELFKLQGAIPIYFELNSECEIRLIQEELISNSK